MASRKVAISEAPQAGPALYAAFWRWHFYAGLLVLPVLMLMALTGGLYLFRNDIDQLVYRDLIMVEARGSMTSPQTWVDAAERSLGGRVVQLTPPAQPDRSVVLVVEAAGGPRSAYVDPHDGRYLGSVPQGGAMAVVKRVHSLDLFGPAFNMLVEVVAGWAIVLVATGLYLWWPRGQAGGVVTVRSTPRKRLFWRDLHAVTGLFAGAVLVFLAATGMPWSAVWGQQARHMINEASLGRPPAPRSAEAGGHAQHAAANSSLKEGAVPWALQDMPVEMAGMDMAGMHHEAPALGVDAMVAVAEAAGLPRPFVLSLPKAEGGLWSAAYMPDKVEQTRTLYLDGRTGRAAADIGYRDFGAGAKAIEWGIAVHQGQQFGPLNKALMAAGCVCVWLLGISALAMWWKRRPRRGLGAPPAPTNLKSYRGLGLIVVPLGLFYPLVGASLVLVLAVDLLLRLAAPKVRIAFGV